MRFILIRVLAQAIAATNATSPGMHSQLCRNLESLGLLGDITFVTTNYDTFLDDALIQLPNISIDYGLSTDPFAQAGRSTNLSSVLKVHGSLDWRYCQSCLSTEKAANNNRISEQCRVCEDFMVPLIVPPTFFKQMDNPILSSVWQAFRRHLYQAHHIVFCGYSFPDADMHVKYAFKHREVATRRLPLKITVINEHPGKPQQIRTEEQLRYKRFFRSSVNYTTLSFQDFATDPAPVLN
jgi:NAD-dependent SIR2 family protein deacetylase